MRISHKIGADGHYVPTEQQDCIALVKWMDQMHLRFSHVTNENKAKSRKEAMIMGNLRQREGVRSGVPDFILVLPDRLLFVEMKRKGTTASDVKPEQREWIAALNMVPNVRAVVCRGFDEAVAEITEQVRRSRDGAMF